MHLRILYPTDKHDYLPQYRRWWHPWFNVPGTPPRGFLYEHLAQSHLQEMIGERKLVRKSRDIKMDVI